MEDALASSSWIVLTGPKLAATNIKLSFIQRLQSVTISDRRSGQLLWLCNSF